MSGAAYVLAQAFDKAGQVTDSYPRRRFGDMPGTNGVTGGRDQGPVLLPPLAVMVSAVVASVISERSAQVIGSVEQGRHVTMV